MPFAGQSSPVTLDISHIVPLDNENRWTDLLAVLIEADPAAPAALLGLGDRPHEVRAHREVGITPKDRVDLLLDVDGQPRAVVEVKLLSGLSSRQLSRYREALPAVDSHVLLYSEQLPIDIALEVGWRAVTWESLLGAFAESPSSWVAETARAWLAHLKKAMPKIDGDTAWNDLRDGEDFVIAMRARMSWVYSKLRPPSQVTQYLAMSSAGVSWVAGMRLETVVPGYHVKAEAEERLPVYSYPKKVSPMSRPPVGPSIKVFLGQPNVQTSADFDWAYLLQLWPLMAAARNDWVRKSARPKAAHDRVGWQGIVQRGAPAYLGIGFGEGQIKRSQECMFGARFQLGPDVRLAEVVEALEQTASLMVDMAAVIPTIHAPDG